MKPLMLSSGKSQRFVLHEADWKQYVQLRRSLDDRGQRAFVTFDGHRLELMSPSMQHDRAGELLGVVVRAIGMATGSKLIGGGSTTFKKRSARRGLEPDRCFWIQNYQKLVGVKHIDLSVHPPPDLAIEVEVSRRLLDRRAIYARLGVPELWVYNARTFQILRLGEANRYQITSTSGACPTIRCEGIEALLEAAWTMDDTEWQSQLEDWLRKARVE
jgi:Uma2 family endonuclease